MRKFIAVVLVLAVVQYWDSLSGMFFPTPVPALRSDATVIMYGAQWCGYCAKARAFFQSKGVAFREYDIEQSAEARQQFEALGGRGVPLIVINQKLIRGFDQRRIIAALRD